MLHATIAPYTFEGIPVSAQSRHLLTEHGGKNLACLAIIEVGRLVMGEDNLAVLDHKRPSEKLCLLVGHVGGALAHIAGADDPDGTSNRGGLQRPPNAHISPAQRLFEALLLIDVQVTVCPYGAPEIICALLCRRN